MLHPKVHNILFKGHQTHAYVIGRLKKGVVPLIVLHGGPGGSSYRYEPLWGLADKGIPLIFYDQLGCGYSKVPSGHKELYTLTTYVEELAGLIDHFQLSSFILLGHSWGGMLALSYALSKKDPRLGGLILYSTLPSTKMWNDAHLRLAYALGRAYGLTAERLLQTGEYDSPQARCLLKAFTRKHVRQPGDHAYEYRRRRFPKRNMEIYRYMWGPSELFGDGTLKDFDVTDQLASITVPTLILSGEHDESTAEMNSLLHERIRNSIRHVIKDARHDSYVDKTEEVLSLIIGWYRQFF